MIGGVAIVVCRSGEKELKPVSGRVGEIAEYMLLSLMEKTVSSQPYI